MQYSKGFDQQTKFMNDPYLHDMNNARSVTRALWFLLNYWILPFYRLWNSARPRALAINHYAWSLLMISFPVWLRCKYFYHQDALLSCLPYLTMFVTISSTGVVVDLARAKSWIKTTTVRKLCLSIGMWKKGLHSILLANALPFLDE